MAAYIILGSILAAFILLAAVLRITAKPGPTRCTLETKTGQQLVVVVHGLSGRRAVTPVVDLARDTYPQADLLSISYDARPLSNADVFDITNQLEHEIHHAMEKANYSTIILIGHSMGAMIVRKALLWGYGIEDDRVAAKGKRPWVDRVERVVSLAGINRGWSYKPRPANMRFGHYVALWVGETVARLTGTGRMALAVQRGSPFIADSRVQWIRLTRAPLQDGSVHRLPQVIHLLGDRDDLVAREDATDLGVSKNTVFVTLANTDHASIAKALTDAADSSAARRREAIRLALLGAVDKLSPDRTQELSEIPAVRQLVYIMHGIRDYGGWTDRLRAAIERRTAELDPQGSAGLTAVVNKKYGYFPMLPFLLYWDRQKNVRRFMDEYTENMALYPNVQWCDFVGHSNGTYILASALQRYRTPRIRRVFFAGSVVPKHYPWRALLDQGRVQRVVNVVADGDWVVALFPKLFEQFADWLGAKPTVGLLDLGAAGFRGFQAADDPRGRLCNLQFTRGQHGTAVDTKDARKLNAIVAFVVDGDETQFDVFRDARDQWAWLDILSNVSWFAWLVLGAILVGLGLVAFSMHTVVGVAFALFVLALLTSI